MCCEILKRLQLCMPTVVKRFILHVKLLYYRVLYTRFFYIIFIVFILHSI